jgi:hypothetical protein
MWTQFSAKPRSIELDTAERVDSSWAGTPATGALDTAVEQSPAVCLTGNAFVGGLASLVGLAARLPVCPRLAHPQWLGQTAPAGWPRALASNVGAPVVLQKIEENAEDVNSYVPFQRECATPNRLAMNSTCFMLSLFSTPYI